MSKYFKKADLILLIIILALSVLGFIGLRKTASNDSMVEISVDGKVVDSLPLSKDTKKEIQSDNGYNILVIESSKVWIEDADCPNKDCMNFGKISKEGQIILCLPHKLSVRIVGGNGGPDAVAY